MFNDSLQKYPLLNGRTIEEVVKNSFTAQETVLNFFRESSIKLRSKDIT